MMRFSVIAAVAIILTACGPSEPIVRLVPAAPPQIPSSLLTCPASPAVPDDGATQADVARYLLDLYDSGESCRENLSAVGKLLKAGQPDDRR